MGLVYCAFLDLLKIKIFALSLAIMLTASSTVYARGARCSDFATQQQAQIYMLTYGAWYLDGDKDGEACECLPGGSHYGQEICRR